MLTKMNMQADAVASVLPTMPPGVGVFGDESVRGTFAQHRTAFGDVAIADDVPGVRPRGVPV